MRFRAEVEAAVADALERSHEAALGGYVRQGLADALARRRAWPGRDARPSRASLRSRRTQGRAA